MTVSWHVRRNVARSFVIQFSPEKPTKRTSRQEERSFHEISLDRGIRNRALGGRGVGGGGGRAEDPEGQGELRHRDEYREKPEKGRNRRRYRPAREGA